MVKYVFSLIFYYAFCKYLFVITNTLKCENNLNCINIYKFNPISFDLVTKCVYYIYKIKIKKRTYHLSS